MRIQLGNGGTHMPHSPDILRLRVLLAFLKEDAETCTVMGIARTLNEAKQTVSRIVIALEKDGLVDRSDRRHPVLTEAGKRKALLYEERIKSSLNHLIYEGVPIESAQNDACRWALYNTDETMAVIRSAEERYRVKYELRDQARFSGEVLCKALKDGDYRFPFIIYREHVKDGSNISMGNAGFEHPCTLSVRNGVGTVLLRAVEVSANSAATGLRMHGRIKNMKYFDAGHFIGADQNGSILSFPAAALQFVNVGEGMGQVLHGAVCLKMQCTVGVIHMPESTAIFTILI